MDKNKNIKLTTLFVALTVFCFIIGGCVIAFSNISTKLTMPDDKSAQITIINADEKQSVGENAIIDESSVTEAYDSELSKLFEDPKQREADLGDNQGKVALGDNTYKGLVTGLTELLGSSNARYATAAETLLTNNAGHPIISVHPCTKKVPKYYAGDMYWLFEDDLGFTGELVVKDNYMYLYYYGEMQIQSDEILQKGLPATSYGPVLEHSGEFDSNSLKEDFNDNALYNSVISALIDGEQLNPESDFYLVNQTGFQYADLFEEVKCYKVNVDLNSVFVEIYIADNMYYTIRSENKYYSEIVPNRLVRNSEVSTELDVDEEDESESYEISIWKFNKSALERYSFDWKEKDLCSVVENLNISNETVAQGLNNAILNEGWEDCTITQTNTVNGYTITNKYVFAIRLPDSPIEAIDYYVNVEHSTGTSTIYPPDATPEQ